MPALEAPAVECDGALLGSGCLAVTGPRDAGAGADEVCGILSGGRSPVPGVGAAKASPNLRFGVPWVEDELVVSSPSGGSEGERMDWMRSGEVIVPAIGPLCGPVAPTAAKIPLFRGGRGDCPLKDPHSAGPFPIV